MQSLFDQHRATLDAALSAMKQRGFWSTYPEIPSGRFYGETAKDDGLAAYESQLNHDFSLPGHPEESRVSEEVSPYGGALGVRYPASSAETLISHSKAAAEAWAATSIEQRTGICLEILARLNKRSFEMAHATMHTSGQAFPMAFQAGGPHAQDRGLEAVTYAYDQTTAIPAQADWIKPQGKGNDIALEKHWSIIPRGVSVLIGCQTFPTWNSYAGFFANLMTANTVIAKPHPAATFPMAITVQVAREVLVEQGLPADVVLLAAEDAQTGLAKTLALHPDVAQIDYTGSVTFGQWLRTEAATPLVYTEEAGVNSIVLAATDDFKGMCQNIAFSLSLYSGQMCTAPQNIFIPRDGIQVGTEQKSFDEVVEGIKQAVDGLLADPARAAMVAGALANTDTLERVAAMREKGEIIRDSEPVAGLEEARTATPLILSVAAENEALYGEEHFGPIVFVVATDSVEESIERASRLARQKGAITAALYDTNEERTQQAITAFAKAGVNLSINLTGGIYVNQSAAFSDFHVTGANPAGNACFTDAAFVANRFRVVMWRRPIQQ